MGDTVQRLMEDMVPELEDLQTKRIFTAAEIQSLVSHRQGFEYKLRRKNISKLDFLRYIQYELNVTALVDRRKVKLGIEKKGVCDFSAMRRLSFLYERALRKFNHDVALWKQYLEYSRRIGSHHAISKILPRALQLNPKDESLWILHASWELEFQGNMEGGRAVLQRALRLNENSQALWLAFTKMELRFIARVLERKRALGLIAGEDAAIAKQEGDFDLRFHGGSAESKDGEEAPKDLLAAKQEEALTQAIIPRAIMRNAIGVKGLKSSLAFRLDFLRLIPSAFSAALSALESGDEEENDEIPSTDPSKISLADYAYNHNVDDILLTNFLRYNGKTNAQLAQENQARNSDDEDMLAEAQHSSHLYHVDFQPFLNELFAGVRRDFAHEVHSFRLAAQFAFTRARIQSELGSSSLATETPEQQAFAVFEDALQPAALEATIAAAKAFYNQYRVELEVDQSPAGRATLDRLRNVKRHMWQAYIELTYGLLRQQPGNALLRTHLQQLYTRAAQEGARSERVLLQQVSFLLETGQHSDAVTILSDAITPAAASSSASVAAAGSPSFSKSLALWSRYLELLEKLCTFQSAHTTDDHEAAETTHGKKRKKASSSASSNGSGVSAAATVAFVCAEFDRAIKAVELDDRIALFERLVSFHCGQLAVACATGSSQRETLRAAYKAVHITFQRVLALVPQPRGAGDFKLRYLQWMATTTSGDMYALLQRRTTVGASAAKPAAKKQKIVVDSDDEDAESSDLPSSVPSLSLAPAAALRQLVDSLLATPPVSYDLVQACINVESTLNPAVIVVAAPASSLQLHQRRMKELYERAVLAFGSTSPELWFSYLSWARTIAQAGPTQLVAPNQVHYRATKELKPDHQAHWAELQTMLVQ